MKSLVKLFISVIFLTVIVVLSARYFITQKLSKSSLEAGIQKIVSSHFVGTLVRFDGLDFTVNSKLEIKADSVSIIEKLTGNALVAVNDISMQIPIAAIISGKGTIKTVVDSLKYSYSGELHLLDFISKNGPQKRGVEEIPKFILENRKDFKFRKVTFNDNQLGRLYLKNVNLKKTSAFELKRRISTGANLDADLRLIGEVSFKDLLLTGDVTTLSTVSLSNLAISSEKDLLKKINLKGNIETRGKLGALEGSLKLRSDDVFTLNGEFEFLSKAILFKEIAGSLSDIKLLPLMPLANISFEGAATIGKEDFHIAPEINFKNIKPIVSSGGFVSEIKGEVSSEKITFVSSSTGLSGTIKTSFSAFSNLKNIFKEKKLFEDIDVEVDIRDLNADEFNFGEFFEDQKNALTTLPDLSVRVSYSNLSLREQVFKGGLNFSLKDKVIAVDDCLLADGEGELLGKLKYQTKEKNLEFAFDLENFELDFLKAIIGNKDIHLAGKFDGSFMSLKQKSPLESKSSILKLKILSNKGRVAGLYEVLNLKDVYDLIKESSDKNSVALDTIDNFSFLDLEMSHVDNKLTVDKIEITTPNDLKIISKGTIDLGDGVSQVSGEIKRKGTTLSFLLEGRGVSLYPKTQQIKTDTIIGSESRE